MEKREICIAVIFLIIMLAIALSGCETTGSKASIDVYESSDAIEPIVEPEIEYVIAETRRELVTDSMLVITEIMSPSHTSHRVAFYDIDSFGLTLKHRGAFNADVKVYNPAYVDRNGDGLVDTIYGNPSPGSSKIKVIHRDLNIHSLQAFKNADIELKKDKIELELEK